MIRPPSDGSCRLITDGEAGATVAIAPDTHRVQYRAAWAWCTIKRCSRECPAMSEPLRTASVSEPDPARGVYPDEGGTRSTEGASISCDVAWFSTRSGLRPRQGSVRRIHS